MSTDVLLEKIPQREPPFTKILPSTYRNESFGQMKSKYTVSCPVEAFPLLPTQDDLPCDDGVPMETERHKKQMDLLVYSLEPWLGERGYVGGNMFVYFG